MKPTYLNNIWQIVLVTLFIGVGIGMLFQPQPANSAETIGKVFKQRADAYGTPRGMIGNANIPAMTLFMVN